MKSRKEKSKSLRVKTSVKAGALTRNRNQKVVRDQARKRCLKVKTNVKAGRLAVNRNQKVIRDREKKKDLKVKTKLKAGTTIFWWGTTPPR